MKIIVQERKIVGDLDGAAAQQMLGNLQGSELFIAAFLEEREGATFLVTIRPHFSVALDLAEKGQTPSEFFAAEEIVAAVKAAGTTEELGTLSAKYESNGDPAAIGRDNAGGFSYGAYQLASLRGSVANFITFLKTADPATAAALETAGGDAGARAGTARFQTAWKDLAKKKAFFNLQHGFIKATYYDVFVDHVKGQIGLDINKRKTPVKNAAWSTAVQHGMRSSIFRRALKGVAIKAGKAGDTQIIKAVYAERRKVQTHFPKVPGLHASLIDRFNKEEADALAAL